MAPKKKAGKKQQDDWEADLGEDPDTAATQAAKEGEAEQTQPAEENDAGDEIGGGGGGLLATLRKTKDKRKKKGKVDNDFVDGEDPTGNGDDSGAVADTTSKAPEEATFDDDEDVFAGNAGKKGKGGVKSIPEDDDDNDSVAGGGGMKSKKEKEKEKREREKARKKEQVELLRVSIEPQANELNRLLRRKPQLRHRHRHRRLNQKNRPPRSETNHPLRSPPKRKKAVRKRKSLLILQQFKGNKRNWPGNVRSRLVSKLKREPLKSDVSRP